MVTCGENISVVTERLDYHGHSSGNKLEEVSLGLGHIYINLKVFFGSIPTLASQLETAWCSNVSLDKL